MNYNNKFAFEYSANFISEFNKIIEPLQYLKIPVFSYLKIINDNRYLMLCNHSKWLQYHFKNIHNQGRFFANESNMALKYKTHYLTWPSIPTDHVLTALHNYDIWNGISFFKKSESSLERFCFATNINDFSLSSLYLNHIDLLKRFLRYFGDKSKIMLKNYDYDYLATFKDIAASKTNQIPKSFNKEEFFINYPINKLSINGNNIELSKREAESLKYLSEGRAIKEIAQLMKLSPSTIESYIYHIKIKAGYARRSELIKAYQNCLKYSHST